MMRTHSTLVVVIAALAACGDESPTFPDAGMRDAATSDGNVATDGGDVPDGGEMGDGGTVPDGSTVPDGGSPPDGGTVTDGGTTPDGGTVSDGGSAPDAPTQSAMWRGAEQIESLGGSAQNPVAGMDAAGRAIVVWSQAQSDGETEGSAWGWIHAIHFDPGSGWGAPIALSPAPTAAVHAESFELDLAVNAMGEAMAVWSQTDADGNVDLVARRYTPAGGWAAATVLLDATTATTAGVTWAPHVALAGDGTAIALWSQRAGLDMHLYARRFVPSSGWGPATLIQSQPMADALAGDVAMDGSGDAVAVWTVKNAGGTLWASRFTAPAGWSTPVRLDEAAFGQGVIDADDPHVAVEPAGNAVVVWKAWDGEDQMVWAVTGSAAGTWQPAMRLDAAGVYALSPDVAIDATGDAIAVWHGWPDGEPPSIRARRFTPGSGWSAVEFVETSSETAVFPAVAMTPGGTATVVWEGRGASGQTWANRYVPGAGWGTPESIGTTAAGGSESPAVAAGGVDSAVAVWPHNPMPINNHPSPSDLWANVFR